MSVFTIEEVHLINLHFFPYRRYKEQQRTVNLKRSELAKLKRGLLTAGDQLKIKQTDLKVNERFLTFDADNLGFCWAFRVQLIYNFLPQTLSALVERETQDALKATGGVRIETTKSLEDLKKMMVRSIPDLKVNLHTKNIPYYFHI